MGRKKQRQRRSDTNKKFLLVTNGKVTEKSYLKFIERRINNIDNRGCQVKTLPIDGGDPLSVLNRLQSPQGDTSDYDQVWIVIDEDGDYGKKITEFVNTCKKLEYQGVVSVPCFEVWLVAHRVKVKRYPNQAAAQQHWEEVYGLEKGSKEIPDNFRYQDFLKAAKNCCVCNDYGEEQPIPKPNTISELPTTPMPHLFDALAEAIAQSRKVSREEAVCIIQEAFAQR